MNPIFSLQYGEFAVANVLTNALRNTSIFIPASAQEKGIDLLLYRFDENENKNSVVSIQVKMSRTYTNKHFSNNLWFNRFDPQKNADWFILVGIYADFPKEENNSISNAQWKTIMLAFSNAEMCEFMDNVRQKRNPEKPDKMFGFGFNNEDEIFQTRGCSEMRHDMSNFLLKNRINEIEQTFKRKM